MMEKEIIQIYRILFPLFRNLADAAIGVLEIDVVAVHVADVKEVALVLCNRNSLCHVSRCIRF